MNRNLWFTVAALFVAVAVAFFVLRPRGPHGEALQVRELATRGLAAHLATVCKGERALVVGNPYTHQAGQPRAMREMEESGLRGLRAGLGESVPLAGPFFPELKPEARENPRAVFIDPETTTPLSYLVTDEAFDKLAADHPECSLIISLIGLPAGLNKVKCWQDSAPQKFALLLPDLRILGNRAAIRRSFAGGKLIAFVLARPDAPVTPVAEADWAREFENRFVLITRENLEQVMRTHPQFFPAP